LRTDDRELGEPILPPTDLHRVTLSTQRRNDPIERRPEPSPGLLNGEQVHILGRPVNQSVLADCPRAGQNEAGIIADGPQGQTGDAPLLLLVSVHAPIRSRGKRLSHKPRTRGSMFKIGHTSMSRSRFIKRHCSSAVPSASNA